MAVPLVREESKDRFLHTEACKFLGIGYHRLMYAVAREWITPETDEFDRKVYTRDSLLELARRRKIKLPQ